MPKKVLIALPPAMLEIVDFIAKVEHRTRSDLIREALRRYIETFRRTNSPGYINTSGGISSQPSQRPSNGDHRRDEVNVESNGKGDQVHLQGSVVDTITPGAGT